MYCQLGQDIFQLRQQNRDLLRELQTNSVLLEKRIMNLRNTARTPGHTDKSWKELPPSPLKRKYESWKARKSFGHVNATPPESIDSQQENVKPSPNSIAKRSKRNITIVSGVKKKHRHSRCHKQQGTSKPSPEKSTSKQKVIQKKKKPCAQCYCPDVYIETENKTDGAVVTGKVYFDTKGCETRICCGCCRDHGEIEGLPTQDSLGDGEGLSRKPMKSQPASNIHPAAEGIHFNTPCNSPEQVRSLEDVCSIINYSPESVFLQRLKKRAELIQRNFQTDPVGDKKLKTVKLKENKAQRDNNSDSVHAVKKLPGETRTRRVPTRLIRSNRNKRCASKMKSAQEKHASSGIIRVPVSSCQSTGDQTEASSLKEKKLPESVETRHVPILPLCSCRDGSDHTGGVCSTDLSRSALQDLEHKSCSERKDISPCHCCRILASQRCPCKACKDRTIEKYLKDHDAVSELRRIEDCCCPKAPGNQAWFDELKHFRHKNWCECHAHDHLSEKTSDANQGDDLFKLDLPQPEPKYLERVIMNGEEYFVYRGYAFEKKNKTCLVAKAACSQREESPPSNNLPKEVPVSSRHHPNIITLPSKRKPMETSPRTPRKETVRKSSKNVSNYKVPVPTNSFALRYQKGVV